MTGGPQEPFEGASIVQDRELAPDVRGERAEKRAWIRPEVSVLGAGETDAKATVATAETTVPFPPFSYGPS